MISVNEYMSSLPNARNGNQSIRAQSSSARRLHFDGSGLHVLSGDSERGAKQSSEDIARQLRAFMCGGDPDGMVRTMKLEDVEWSVRARNALSANGIGSIAELYDVDGLQMSNWRSCGQITFREILHVLLSRGIRPPWMVKVCAAFRYEMCVCENGDAIRPAINLHPPKDYTSLTNGYTSGVYWMMECVIADMNRGRIAWCLKPGTDGLALWRSGGIEIGEEE